jgi:serine/threonine protein kinase
MLTGISLFNAASEASLLYDVLHTAPVPIHQARPDLPPAFSQLIMRCVDKNPLNRPQNMDDLAKALEDIPLEMNWTQTQARLWWNTRDHLLFPNQG